MPYNPQLKEETAREKAKEGNGKTPRMGCWNVRSLNKVGKLEEVKREMKRYRLNILGISEVRWKGQGDFDSDGVRVIYSGGNECQRGIAVMLDGEVAKRVTCVEQVSDRILAVKISTLPVDMLIVQIYMPTTDYEDEEF